MNFIKKHRFLILALLSTFIFLTLGMLTISHYGVSWDEALHFRRGQAYIHYFLTGKLNYDDFPKVNLQGTEGDPKKTPLPRRSFYQNDYHNGEFMLREDSGHPPINGELAAFSNYLLFQKLGFVGDITSYHMFNILASSLLVFVVVFFASESLGIFAGLISFLALFTYPLFWAESHFNIKDPPEAAFFAATIWTFYKSLNKGSIKWLLLSGIFFGLALGTKFNVLFLPIIILPFLVIKYNKYLRSPMKAINSIPRRYLLVLLLSPLLIGIIFFGSWPYLWQNVPHNLLNIFGYYKEIGTGYRYQPDNFYLFGFNTFPIQWIIFTTPPLVLLLFSLGVFSLFLTKNKGKVGVGVLWLLWVVVPIFRVTLPNAVIYGGIRQVLEFLPAMALLSGLGVWQIIKWMEKFTHDKKLIYFAGVVLIILFIWPAIILIKIHPYENVYFNFMIGGLSGAKEKNFPSWGNTFGNAYLQGIKWLNDNAPFNSKLALIQGTTANVPHILLRSDINYQNKNFSGIDRKGEYLMELQFNDTGKSYYYAWEYVEKFLVPVYEVKIDNVTLLTIWKNDLEHTKIGNKKDELIYQGESKIYNEGRIITVGLDKEVEVSRLNLEFDDPVCLGKYNGWVSTSVDGKNWQREKDQFPFEQVYRRKNIDQKKMEYFFPGRYAKFLRVNFERGFNCPLTVKTSEVIILK